MKKLLIIFSALLLSLSGQTAKFPPAIAGDSQLKVAANNVQTTLSSAVAPTDNVLVVKDSTGFQPNMIATVDAEEVAVCAVAGNVISVGISTCPNVDGRGFDGTAAASHSAVGAKCSATNSRGCVSVFMTAWHHNALAKEITAIETALGPNLANVAAAASGAAANAASFMFAAQQPGGSVVNGNNQMTLSPVPRGVNGTDTNHYLWVSGGSGTAEACLITGGTAVAAASSGTIILNCANSHSGAWTVQSATAGIQEALQSQATAGGGIVTAAYSSAPTVNATITMQGNNPLALEIGATGLNLANGSSIVMTGTHHSLTGSGVSPLTATTTGGDVIKLTGCYECSVQNVALQRSATPAISTGNGIHLASGTNTHFSASNILVRNQYRGVFAEVPPSQSQWTNVNVKLSVSDGIKFAGQNDEHMVNVQSEVNGGHGLTIGDGASTASSACIGGFRGTNIVIYANQGDGVHVEGSGTQQCNFIFLTNLHADSDMGHELFVSHSFTGYITGSIFNGGTSNQIGPDVSGYAVTGTTFHNTVSNPLHVTGANHVQFSNVRIDDANGATYIGGATGTAYEILIDGASNRITFDSAFVTAPDYRAPGPISITDGTCWGIHMNNMDFGNIPDFTGTLISIANGVYDTWVDAPFWTELSLQNGWAESVNAQYRLERGNVRLRGTIAAGTTTDSTAVFTLPVGFRPASTVGVTVMLVSGGGTPSGVALLQIGSDGVAHIYQGSGAGFLRLDGAAFAIN